MAGCDLKGHLRLKHSHIKLNELIIYLNSNKENETKGDFIKPSLTLKIVQIQIIFTKSFLQTSWSSHQSNIVIQSKVSQSIFSFFNKTIIVIAIPKIRIRNTRPSQGLTVFISIHSTNTVSYIFSLGRAVFVTIANFWMGVLLEFLFLNILWTFN